MRVVTDEVDGEPATGAPRVDQLLRSPAYRQSANEREVELLAAIRKLHVEIETGQRDLERLVGEAHRQGVSWGKIGEAQGVTAQAAQQRAKRSKRIAATKSKEKSQREESHV